MFQSIPAVPPDPIFSLLDEFQADPNPDKINLTVGAWKNSEGQTPVLHCVKQAEERILASEATKNYLGIAGLGSYNQQIARLLLGNASPAINEGRAICIQTPGGTGALRIAAGFLETMRPHSRLWIGSPTWSNHLNIFSQADVQIRHYDHLTADKKALNFEALLEAFSEAVEGDAFLFHTCCHNPSGFDLEMDQWEIAFGFMRERNFLPIFDCAYQGFRTSIDDDVWPLRRLAELETEFLVCSSNSKNFGLYGERVGALTGVCVSPDDAERLQGYLGSLIRAIYSNPPKHGAAIVATVLEDQELRQMWIEELGGMRERIGAMRSLLLQKLESLCGPERFEFMHRQNGMFSYTGLTPEQVDRLRTEFAVYMLRSGRINVSGVNESNAERLCQAIAAVL